MKRKNKKYDLRKPLIVGVRKLNEIIKFKRLFGLFCITLIFSLQYPSFIQAQRIGVEKDQNPKEIKKNAEISLQEGKFEKAILLYNKLLEEDEKNPLLNFLVGFCYLNTDFGLEQSIHYLKNATENGAIKPEDKAPFEAYYYLGQAYHKNNQFDEAIKTLEEALRKAPKNEFEYISKTKKLLENAENARQLAQSTAKVKVENALDFNSKYSDRNPLINKELDIMIFTSRRENSINRKKNEDGQYDENIFQSEKVNDTWKTPYELSNQINTIEHESACWLSEDGNIMIIQRVGKEGTNLYLSKKSENGWGIPEKLNPPINGNYSTTFGCMSPDDKYIYFTSDRKGGLGGTDIYVSENLGNNRWGPAKNLGSNINTPFNEESPYLSNNGVFFFSSEGHTSMGGFDIFASVRDASGNWTAPVNLGVPINSTNDDFFYRPNADGQSAYLSSDRNGTKGKSDIFSVDYSDSLMNTTTIVAGAIKCPRGFDAYQNILIRIKNQKDNRTITIRPTKSGKYNFYLPSDAVYIAEFISQNSVFYKAELKIGKSYSPVCADQFVVLKGLTVDSSSLVAYSKANPEIYQSISLVTDNIKNSYLLKYKEINENLSQIKNNGSKDIDSIFSIQLTRSKSRIPLTNFQGLKDVKESRDNIGNYIYTLGEYNYEWEALVKLRMIKEEYPDAIVYVNKKNKNDLEN